mmetsp:Transcript_65823/g.172467  ORF Transcript_65823/g.172467 Transcript_65823/m.172467 type:complete len:252 (-) Transcript_65823:716-1471(-)
MSPPDPGSFKNTVLPIVDVGVPPVGLRDGRMLALPPRLLPEAEGAEGTGDLEEGGRYEKGTEAPPVVTVVLTPRPSTWSSWVCFSRPSRSSRTRFSSSSRNAFSRSTLDRTSRCMASLQSSRNFCTAVDQPSLLSRKLLPPPARTSRRAASTMLFNSLFVATKSCCMSRRARVAWGESPPLVKLLLLTRSGSWPEMRAAETMRSNFSTSICRAFDSSARRCSTSVHKRSTEPLTCLRSWLSLSTVLLSSSI